MGHIDPPLSYNELLHAFQDAIDCVLSGAIMPPISALFDLTLTLTLLDIAYAVRQGRPTQALITRACAAFAVYAEDNEQLNTIEDSADALCDNVIMDAAAT